MSNTITHEGTHVRTMIVSTETHRLVGWGDFASLAPSIKMRLFGHMVRLATPVVKEFHGDLLIDAGWVENIDGPVTFLYTVRHSGTNLGSLTAPLALASNPSNAYMYEMALTVDDKGEWYLSITQHMLVVSD